MSRWVWGLIFAVLGSYVAARMGAFSLSANVDTPSGVVSLPNTFASVDHPFHVARAETLWRELGAGHFLRWVGQHQGGYPVEFYPLGEAWLEVAVRTLSLGTLSGEAAHTLSVIAIFLAPGIAFATLARFDGWSPAVGVVALVLHISLPGSWYHGGYTELVQWGLVTNVAAAVAVFLMMPPLIRYLVAGEGRMGATAALFAAAAIYCNPRSILGLAALGAGVWLAVALRERRRKNAPLLEVDPRAGDKCVAATMVSGGGLALRLGQIAVLAALIAAPELVALVRFADLYAFVHYSGYDEIAAYVDATVSAVAWPVVALGLIGLMLGLTLRQRLASAAAAIALSLYVLLTVIVSFVPVVARVAPQLEPTRLMPLQRLLIIYLAAVAVWVMLDRLLSRLGFRKLWVSPLAAVGLAAAVLLFQTRPLTGAPPDPASPAVPRTSLYPVEMSAHTAQADLESAVQVADNVATPGTALLILGSALSWHQQLWSPLWTPRPLFYDNWLWYWRPDHAGTPGYEFLAGHHYPDPERALQRSYLERHGIGAVVAAGPASAAAANSSWLESVREGTYAVYTVIDPVTTVTFGSQNAALLDFSNQRIEARSEAPAASVTARVNWHPRWAVRLDGDWVPATRRHDGYIEAASTAVTRTELDYTVQPLDWVARMLGVIGLLGISWLGVSSARRRFNSRRLLSSSANG